MTYPMLRDGSSDSWEAFGVVGYPETFVIDRRGRIAAVTHGPVDESGLRRQVLPLLQENLVRAGSPPWRSAALVVAAAAAAAECTKTSVSDLEDEVMCPVCGTSLGLAREAPQASRERAYIARLVRSCRSKDEIKAALVDEFGESVLALPARTASTYPQYVAPLLALLLAGIAIVVALARWRRAERVALRAYWIRPTSCDSTRNSGGKSVETDEGPHPTLRNDQQRAARRCDQVPGHAAAEGAAQRTAACADHEQVEAAGVLCQLCGGIADQADRAHRGEAWRPSSVSQTRSSPLVAGASVSSPGCTAPGRRRTRSRAAPPHLLPRIGQVARDLDSPPSAGRPPSYPMPMCSSRG